MRFLVLLLVTGVLSNSCSDDSNTGPGSFQDSTGINPSDWLVPSGQVFDGGPGRDGIPALEDPEMAAADLVNYLSPADLVVGFKVGNETRAYPHRILDWHEIINDTYTDKAVAITYCPLTGTAVGWNRVINGTTTTFGVSGLLFQTNLMPFDRLTESTWSQMRLDCVNGPLIGTKAETYQVVETTWNTWKEMYPDTKVNTLNTGFSRNYNRFPYIQGGQDYRTSNDFFLFPFSPNDTRLPSKERVLGVLVGEDVKVYPLASMDQEITVIEDTFNGINIVVVGSIAKNFMVAYQTRTDQGSVTSLSPAQDSLPIVMTDREGNGWSVFGEALSGPRAGQKLVGTSSWIGYWFTFGSFYPAPEIYNEDS